MASLIVCLCIAAAVCIAVWVLSVVTHEHSWVDRIWSIVPVVYLWVFAAGTGFADARVVIMAVLATMWGARLTFNFARKGGYARGGEDYRWSVLRARMSPGGFALFNLFFIVIFQNIVLLLITVPALTAAQHPSPLGALDGVAAALFLALLVGETVADQQQWRFQSWKAAEREAGMDPHPRFLQRGLVSVSRHPNYFFEIAQWWVIFFFGAIAAASVLQWTVIGAVLLSVLFVGSTVFTEQITKSRYPEYAEYQSSTSAVIPWFPRRSATRTDRTGLA
jgi:steroid 5-alpha reductase family enzyme